MSLLESEALVRVLFGERAVHVPLNFIVQGGNREGALIALVGNSEIKDLDDHPLRFGSRATHQLVLGDVVVRPRLVIESDAFRGHGLAALATGPLGDLDAWLRAGRVIVG